MPKRKRAGLCICGDLGPRPLEDCPSGLCLPGTLTYLPPK